MVEHSATRLPAADPPPPLEHVAAELAEARSSVRTIERRTAVALEVPDAWQAELADAFLEGLGGRPAGGSARTGRPAERSGRMPRDGGILEAALSLLASDSSESRRAGMLQLRRAVRLDCSDGERARRALVSMLFSDSACDEVRVLAASALGYVGGESLVQPLTTALNVDRNFNVRREAAIALGRISSPVVQREAVQQLTQAMHVDVDDGVQAAAAGAILAIQPQGANAAEASAVAFRLLRAGRRGITREVAAAAVQRAGGPDARAALEAAADGDSQGVVRRAARRALKAMPA